MIKMGHCLLIYIPLLVAVSVLRRGCLALQLLLLLSSTPASLLDALYFSTTTSTSKRQNGRAIWPIDCFGFQRPGTKLMVEKDLSHSSATTAESPFVTSRRKSFLSSLVFSSIIAALEFQEDVSAAPINDKELSSVSSNVSPKKNDPSTIATHTVFFDVRISRRDGTFYVRDDDDPSDQVFKGRILVDLYGAMAPTHVGEFLKYVSVNEIDMEDSPFPSYGRSMFTRLDPLTGLLEGGFIPGLDVMEIGGGTALKYSGGRVLSAPLWIEKGAANAGRISHGSAVGLVTHRLLDVSPCFGITTRKAPELDATHFVFGRVRPDDTSISFLQNCVNLPTYSVDRRIQADNAVIDDLAGKFYATQKDFFRSAAKTLGDSRIDKVYEGKLLRKVDVTKVGLI